MNARRGLPEDIRLLQVRSLPLSPFKSDLYHAYPVPPSRSLLHATSSTKSLPVPPASTACSSQLPPQVTGFDAAAHILTLAFDAKDAGRVFRDPRDDANLPLPDERVFIVAWVDYCNKYGMGYALTDGSVGVHFNDSTSLVLSPDKQ